jgi:hypothetical protein
MRIPLNTMPNPAELYQDGNTNPSQPHVYGQNPSQGAQAPDPFPVARVQIRRDVFWQNVCREILMGLAAAASESAGRTGTGPTDAEMSTSPTSHLFDGRMAILTISGQRIPIADVYPMFAFSVPGDAETRARSDDVQCTVFRITTPTGENFTLPISQIVGVHSLSQSLIEKIEEAEGHLENEPPQNRVPFGFAAYTSLARSELQASQPQQTDENPSPDTTS